MDKHTATPKKMGITMLILAWLVLFGLMAMFFDDWLGKQHNPNQNPVTNTTSAVREVVLLPNRQHHYIVNGSINGKEVVFLLDTGATDVVVPEKLAQRLGLGSGQQRFANTANGTIVVYNTQLDLVQIGDIRLRDIRASINPAMSGDLVLLGMSALRQIEFSQQGDTLILRQ